MSNGIEIDVVTKSDSAERDLKRINESLAGIKKTTDNVTASLASMAKSIALSAASLSTFAGIIKISDQFTELSNKIALVTGRTGELIYAQKELLDITARTRGSIQGSAAAFNTLGRSMKSVGTSTDDILKATEAIQQAAVISGASVDSANAAIIQLGQGLSSGVLRGDEFNSVLEQTPRIAQAIADNLKLSIGQLRTMANEGKLTSDIVFKSLLEQSAALNKEFATLAPTAGQGLQALSQASKEFANELLIGLGISDSLGKSFIGLAQLIRTNAKDASTNAALFISSFLLGLSAVEAIAKPIISIFKTLGTELVNSLPTLLFTRTLAGDVYVGLRKIDGFFGGFFHGIYNEYHYFFEDLFTINTPVEAAIKSLKRIAPAKIFANSGTLSSFFTTDTLYAYANALNQLAIAMKSDIGSMSSLFRGFERTTAYAFQDAATYIGLIPDTLVKLRFGAIDALLDTVTALLRGFTGLQISIFDFRRQLDEMTGEAYVQFFNVLKDIAVSAPLAITKGIQDAVTFVIRAVVNMSRIVANAWRSSFHDPIIFAVAQVNLLGNVINNAFTKNIDIHKLFDDVIAGASKMANIAGNIIKNFSNKVIDYFFVIYDDVIAHSWWTDTMDGVVNQANALLGRVTEPLNRFKTFVSGVFTSILKLSNSLFSPLTTAANKLSSSIKDHVSSTARKVTGTDTIADKVKSNVSGLSGIFGIVSKDLTDKLVLAFTTFTNEIPDILRVGLLGVGAAAVALLFPGGAIKTVVGLLLTETILTNASLVAEKFASNLFNGSFITTAAKALGSIIGNFVGSFVAHIPQLLNALLGLVSGFFQGFLAQMPILGAAISGIFSSVGSLGVSGPLGIIAAYFFGPNLLKLISYFGIFSKQIDALFVRFATFSTLATSLRGGAFGTFFFGTFGAERIIGIIGVVLSSLGAFDSLFAHSYLAKTAIEGGLLYLALLGKPGADKIRGLYGSVVAPLIIAIKDSVKSIATGDGIIAKVILGNNGSSDNIIKTGQTFVLAQMDRLSKFIIDKGATYGKKAIDFTTLLLFGTKEGETANKIKDVFKTILDTVKTNIKKLTDILSKTDLFKKLFPASSIDASNISTKYTKQPFLDLGPSNLSSTKAQSSFDFGAEPPQEKAAKASVDRITQYTSAANAKAASIGGETGLIGKAVFGKYGKLGLLVAAGAALLAITGFANAAETSAVKSYSVTNEVIDSLTYFASENPFKLVFAGILVAAAGVFVALPGLIAPALSGVGAALKATFSSQVIGAIASTVAEFATKISGSITNIGLTLKSAAIGGGLAAIFGGSDTAIALAAATAGALVQVFEVLSVATKAKLVSLGLTIATFSVNAILGLTGIGFAFGFVEASAVAAYAAILLPITIAVAAFAALGSVIIAVFGTGDNFAEKFDQTIRNIAVSIGLADKNVNAFQAKLDGAINGADRKNGVIQIEYSFGKVDFSKLDKDAKENIGKVVDKLAEARKKEIEEKHQLGEATKSTVESVDLLNKQVKNLIAKAEAANRKDLGKEIANINESSQAKNNGTFTGISNSLNQGLLNFEFNLNKAALQTKLFANRDNLAAAAKLKDLESRKGTDYRAGYVAPTAYNKEIQTTLDKIDTTFNLAADPNQTVTMQGDNKRIQLRFEDAVDTFRKASEELAVQKTSNFSIFGKKNPAMSAALTNQKSAQAGLTLAANSRLQAQLDGKAVLEYQKSISDLNDELQKVGITFTNSPLFTSGSQASDSAQSYDNEISLIKTQISLLVQLSNQAKLTKNNKEALDNFLSQRDLKTTITREQRQAGDQNTMSPDQLLTSSIDKSGSGLDATALQNLPVQFKLTLSNLAQQLETSKEKLTYKDLIVGKDAPESAKKRVQALLDSIQAEIAAKKNDIQAAFTEIMNSDDVGARTAVLKSQGIDTPQADVTSMESPKLKLKQQLQQTLEIYKSLAKGSMGAFPTSGKFGKDQFDFVKNSKDIENLESKIASLNPKVTTLAGTFEEVAKIGFNFKPFQRGLIPDKVFDKQLANAREYESIQQKISAAQTAKDSSLGNVGMSDVERNKALARQQAILKEAEAAQAQFVPKSFNEKLTNIGVTSQSFDLKSAFQLPPGVVDQFNIIADKMNVINRQANDPNLTSGQIEALAKQYITLYKAARALKEANDNFGDSIDLVNSNLAGIALTPAEYANMYDKERLALRDLAIETRNYNEALKESRNLDPDKAKAIQAKIDANNLKAKNFITGRNSTKATSLALGGVGISTPEDVVGRIPEANKLDINNKANDIAAKQADLVNLSGEARQSAQLIIDRLIRELTVTVKNAPKAEGIANLEKAGISISQDSYNLINDINKGYLDGLANAISVAKATASTTTDDNMRIAAQNTVNTLTFKLNEEVAKLTVTRENSPGYLAGQTLANSVSDSISQGIGDVIRKKKSVKDFFLGVLDTFTNGVIDSFVGGLTKSLTGKNSAFHDLLGGLGESIFGAGNFNGTTSEKDNAAAAMSEAANAMNRLVDSLMGTGGSLPGLNTTSDLSGSGTANPSAAVDALGNTLTNSNDKSTSVIGNGLKSLDVTLGSSFARLASQLAGGSGGGVPSVLSTIFGAIKGPLLNMVAPGLGNIATAFKYDTEIGSRQTGLLQDQTGDMLPFADGGVIPGNPGMPMPVLAHGGEVILNEAQQNALMGGSNKSEQQFNINVTGDISRQTRSEIQKMIPQIASGVNQHNYENGRR